MKVSSGPRRDVDEDEPGLREFRNDEQNPLKAGTEAITHTLGSRPDASSLKKVLRSCPTLLTSHLGGGHGRWVIPYVDMRVSKAPDFVIGQKSSFGYEWKAVVLMDANGCFYSPSGKPARHLAEAIKRLRAWRKWLDGNYDFAAKSRHEQGLGLLDLYNPMPGLILGCRESEMDDFQNTKRRDMSRKLDVEIRTYDWIIRAILDGYRQLPGMFMPVGQQFDGTAALQRMHPLHSSLTANTYMPARWYEKETEVPAERLRQAKRRGKIRTKKIKNQVRYSVNDAITLWPSDMKLRDDA